MSAKKGKGTPATGKNSLLAYFGKPKASASPASAESKTKKADSTPISIKKKNFVTPADGDSGGSARSDAAENTKRDLLDEDDVTQQLFPSSQDSISEKEASPPKRKAASPVKKKTPKKPTAPKTEEKELGASGRKRKTVKYTESDAEGSDYVSESSESSDTGGDDSEEDGKAVSKKRKAAASRKTAGKKKKIAVSEDEEEAQEEETVAKKAPTKKAKIELDEEQVGENEEGMGDEGEEAEDEVMKSADGEDGAAPSSRLSVFLRGSKATESKPNKKMQQSRDKILKAVPTEAESESMALNSEELTDNCHWVKPANRRDAEKRRPGEEGFDERTLFVPEKDYKFMTPAQKQYWDIKAKNFDLVLFFKVGKFYELFDDDAHVGVQQLGLTYMKKGRPHSGFPESGFNKYAEKLVALGYKVGRVEQTENPKMLEERNKRNNTKDKAVMRKMTSILTQGTVVEGELLGRDSANYLLSLTENSSAKTFGVCFVDTSTGAFYVGQFEDDRQGTRLRTLLAQIRPREVIFNKESLSKKSEDLLRNELVQGVLKTAMRSDEFWDRERVTAAVKLGNYFSASQTDLGERDAETSWPKALAKLFEDKQEIAIAALGGCMCYLQRLMLDQELLSCARIKLYDPTSRGSMSEFLVLDGQTLQNLEILSNTEGGTEGTLLKQLDHCASAFGKRLLREWVSRPLGRATAINARLDAVEELMRNEEILQELRKKLKSLPDLERMLARIHSFGIVKETNAIMYENVNAKKVDQFIKTLQGFKAAAKLPKLFAAAELQSELLQKLATVGGAEGFPDLSEALDYFSGAFDCAESSKLGYIKPVPGVVAEYDEAEERVVALEQRLEDHRQEMCDYFGAREIKYVNQGKELNQLEIPLEKTKGKKLPDDFELKSSTKKVGRYWTPTIQKLLPKLEAAREAKEIVVGDISRQMFCKFCEHYQLWMRCVESLAQLDCLCSLTIASRYAEGESCRPETCEGEPFLEIRQGRHPCLESIQKGGSFIANDTVLGAGENPARFVLVSGPNMGGKSTLLRQTCTIVIMAQLGCYVPASSCKYTPIDRIFTRVGANDRIMQGQSTFLVELEETANILRHASPHSLVILDELGRGTSTFDGTAIAWAVIEFLCRTTRCMTLFSTHYHMLMEEFKDDAAIAMYHMACVVDPNSTDVTFLYKFQQGTCSKSHGMNVAKLANLPAALVARAGEMSRSFEVKLEQAHGSRREEDPMPVARRLRDCVADGDLKLLMQYHALLQTNTSATLASS